MKKEHLFLGLSLGLFIVLAVIALSVYSGTTSHADMLARPQFLADPLPTPTPAPLPPGYSPPDMSGIDAQVDLPDLIVKSIEVEPSEPYVFNQATVKVTIKNIGTTGVAYDNNFYTDLYIRDGGPPAPGERGLTCVPGTEFPELGYIVNYTLPLGCQGFWLEGPDSEYVLEVPAVFTEVKSYFLYAQIDTPEQGALTGRVTETMETNNIYPTNQSVWVEAKAPSRFTQSTHEAFFSNYASSLDVQPASAVLTDIYGTAIESDSKLVLGLYEEPPMSWGTTSTPPDYTSDDYNVKNPDFQLNTDDYWIQWRPIIATNDVITPSEAKLAAVWQDYRASISFPDIYLRWAHGETIDAEGHRRVDWGDASHEVQVNTGTSGSAQNPTVAVSPDGDEIVVAWQDNRDHYPSDPDDYDIYLQRYDFSGASPVAVGPNYRVEISVCPRKSETEPDIAAGHDDTFYLVWQTECATNQSTIWAMSGQGDPTTWPGPVVVPDPSAQQCREPSVEVAATQVVSITRIDVSDPLNPLVEWVPVDKEIVVVAWTDSRGYEEGGCSGTGDDIWLTYSEDDMASFAHDRRVNDDCQTDASRWVQDQPVATVTQDKKDVTIQASGVSIEVEDVPIPALHVAWRDFRNSTDIDPENDSLGNDPDIYYAYCPIEPNFNPPYDIQLTIGENQMLNSDKDHTFAWQTEPAKQFDPAIAGKSYDDIANSAREIPYDVYVVWADGRNYDNRNYDIYMWLYGDNFPEGLTSQNVCLNDDVKIHDFNAGPAFVDYSEDRPPPASQMQPSVAAVLIHDDAIIKGGYVYLVWADDRNSLNNEGANDVFFSRSNLTYFANYDLYAYGAACGGPDGYGAGSFVSGALDSVYTDTIWYVIDYDGETDSGTWMGLQTRVSDTITNLLQSDWYPTDELVQSGSCQIPMRGYVGRGSNIVGPAGKWPEGRYAQYRVNFWTRDSRYSPEVYFVSLFHGRASGQGSYGSDYVYLPIILKDSS